MPHTAEQKERIEKIRTLPELVESAIRGLTPEQLDTPYRRNGWTVRQVVHHLVDSHLNAYVRMKLILTEDRPTLKPYDQEKWAELPDVVHAPVSVSLGILRGLHERWCALLDHVRDEEWDRPALHPESGELTLAGLLETYARHGETHVGQILGLRSARKW